MISYFCQLNSKDNKEIHYCEKVGTIEEVQNLLNLYGNKINGIKGGIASDKKLLASKEDCNNLFSNTIAFFSKLSQDYSTLVEFKGTNSRNF